MSNVTRVDDGSRRNSRLACVLSIREGTARRRRRGTTA